MEFSTTEGVPGRTVVASHGVAIGSTVRAKHIGKDIGAGLKSIVGGEIKSYSSMLADARTQALERMGAHAVELGADSVVNVRLTTSQIMGNAAEILAYGTAVSTEPA
ncbi:MAG: YbjQ family protein [Acidimicrobiia bacterium]|nr:YbjQ family protein [Acidimicrobiia bacterium]MBL6926833.1 YbjQ family protein [Acidimicrobiia bacterium]